ncbi:MAG: sulfatase-like hydrolase/transferase [Phycisphaerae bacterium]|nr:sulfatase-like hydrolase/transferase [Phycisphaerae bacterium]
MNRRAFLKRSAAAAALSVLASCNMARPKGKPSKPNILVILVDDLGYGDLSSYGATDLKSPHIDKLMASGLRINNFYANCPVCSPTRAALLTGRYPDLVGVGGVIRTFMNDNFGYFDPEAVTLPDVLNRGEYETTCVGKWHLGLSSPNLPNERGFKHFYGFIGDMMDDYWDHKRANYNYMRENEKEIDPKGHATDIFSDAAIRYFDDFKDKEKPFFMYLAYNAPHFPIQPPQDWLDKVNKRETGISEKRARNVAFVEHLDYNIGRVIDGLKQTGQYENTLIIFTSDNGGQKNVGASNGTLNGNKGQMLEGGIKVPMCAVWPGKIKPAVNDDRIFMTMDIFPTVCQAAGISFDHEIEGVSFLPMLLGKQQALDNRYLIWVRREGWHFGGRAFYAIRKGDFKLQHSNPFEPMQLYNLKADPQEQSPLSDKHPMYKELFGKLRDHIIKAGAVPFEKPGTDPTKVNH